MTYREEKRDLFSVDEDYYFVQCISADLAMGAGIAVKFNGKFRTKRFLIEKYDSKYFVERWDKAEEKGECVREGRVFNLITKREYYSKPTYQTMRTALEALKKMIKEDNAVKRIAMPYIGCGLDKLEWKVVSMIIREVFVDTDLEITVCYL